MHHSSNAAKAQICIVDVSYWHWTRKHGTNDAASYVALEALESRACAANAVECVQQRLVVVVVLCFGHDRLGLASLSVFVDDAQLVATIALFLWCDMQNQPQSVGCSTSKNV